MLKILFLISLRNLWAHKTASVIVGSIIFFGTFLVVIGTSMLDSINESMAKSITSSIAGHLQLYSADARDELVLFGSFGGGDDYGIIENFGPVRKEIEALPNVKAVVPMGVQSSIVLQGNEIDLTLATLREAIATGDTEKRLELRQKLLNVSEDLVADLKNRLPIAADQEKVREGLDDLEKLQSDAFWDRFETDVANEESMLYLESEIAPLAEDGRMYWLRNLGTDLQRFKDLFDRFEVVEGEMIPPGKRGILFSQRFYEKQVKNRVAREFDRAHTNFVKLEKRFVDNPVLEDIGKRLPRQYGNLKRELSPVHAAELSAKIRTLIPEETGDLSAQLEAFLSVNDANFLQRYAFFYDEIGPRIRLYGLPVGKEFSIRSVTKAGYLKTVRIKVWGTYRFKSLEESDLAGAQNLIDMMTFRELYGAMSADMKAELAGIKEEVGIKSLARDNAEDALFGGDDTNLEAETTAVSADFLADDKKLDVADIGDYAPHGPADIDRGLAINAAVVLHDADKLLATKSQIEALVEEKSMGLKVVDWQTAAGIIGQFIFMLQAILAIAILIIFVVALVIINNSMVMATLERTPEIGTMRAIGAQKRMVMNMFLLETTVLGILSGTLGALGGAALMMWLGEVGLPAPNEMMIFLFSGPKLYPSFGIGNLIFAFVVVVLVSLASTFYPARIASGIAPVVAMQSKE